jgi:methylated-DNA-[protein]-cysteine S-methyltransferase
MSIDQDVLPLDMAFERRVPRRVDVAGFQAPLPGPTRYTVMDSPIGDLTLYGDGTALSGVKTLAKDGAVEPIPEGWVSDPAPFEEAVRQLTAYFAGELAVFDLPLAPAGTPWQLRVWAGLTTIPYGETSSYGQLAEELGRPTASRAVGMANGRNPISIIVPCHRVIGADGTLTGYAGGLERKKFLLALEARAAAAHR